MRRPPKTLLVITQIFEPDPAAVGQYLAHAARVLSRRGWRVVVYTANRGYDDPSLRYPRREVKGGIEVRRLPLSSFGKRTMLHRLGGQLSFLVLATAAGLFTRGLRGVLVSTTPPMSAAAALVVGTVRRAPITYWVMDINPDQAVAMGELAPGSPLVRMLEWLNRKILGRAQAIVTLDRYMGARLAAKADVSGRLTVLPLWPIDDLLAGDGDANPYPAAWGITGRRLVMHSGNHSISHPLDTLLAAAAELRDAPGLALAFIGGGLGKAAVDEAIRRDDLANVLSLPYQPRERIRHTLAAADVHVVTMGDEMVGHVHPSKVYNAIALGKPILYLGPPESHLADMVRVHGIGWHVAHGDVAGMVDTLREIESLDAAELAEMGRRAARLCEASHSPEELTERFARLVEG